MANTQKIVLVDGSSYLFRAFHALPQLTNRQGEPTGAIFGVINMLKKLPKQLNTDHIAVVFDAKGKNFRHDLYPEYKANRKAMADELRAQISPVHEIVQKLGFPLIIVDSVEADDVIGTLAKRFAKEGHEVVISTGDKDMAQLVDAHITLMDTMKNEITNREKVIAKFGVNPEQIIDYLALMGDPSDNIPGVPKVGPKTAVKWLSEYQSLQGVIKNADKIAGKVGENLRESLAFLPLSYKLATIKCDLDLPYTVDDMLCVHPDVDYLKKAFTQYEFKGWLRDLEQQSNIMTDTQNHEVESINVTSSLNYQILLTEEDFSAFYDEFKKADIFAFDTETDSLDTFNVRLVGISFALKPYHAVYIPLQHDYDNAPIQLSLDWVVHKIKPILENDQIAKIAQNAKFDLKVLSTVGINAKGVKYDTMLESYVLNSSVTRHDMDSLANHYLQVKTVSFEELAGKGKNQLTFNQIDIAKAGFYAAEDADITYRLHERIWHTLKDIDSLRELYIKEELPVSFVIDRMERIGVKVDADLLKAQSMSLAEKITQLEKECIELAGQTFNLSSPKQLREILYDQMGLPILKKTQGGQASTAEDALQELAEIYDFPKLIMEHRHLTKLKTTYTDKLPLMINSKTSRVHTSYQQAITSTGRLSSTEPNLQNIPIRSSIGREIRKAFIAEKGYKILAADYSQVELRIMAHLSQDPNLLHAFQQGLDVHRATAAETLGIKPDDVTSEQRRQAKAVNFGLIYGMGAFGLAKQLGIPRGEAQEYIDIYFARYPGVKRYMEDAKVYAMQHGFVETIFGRRLHLPEINSRNMAKKRAAERVAINAPMQGSAADIIKRAMILIDKWIIKEHIDARMIMQVHDELVFEVKEDQIEKVGKEIKQFMESAVLLKVPLIADVGVGDNWDEAH
ncbi:DNA polymerase I [Cysteiniphilum halobium]|uniref:DNA polymerase I n=1 Tax=Cysteiniphilum halobium TaxID=2219059 RepID=UPI000E64FC2F|nr:DNA polymerase I [Cysteiniphilum halobium]